MKNAGSYWKTTLAAGLVLTLGAFASPAAAQRADEMRNSQNPCVGDAQRICNEFIPDRAKVASCLFKNKSRLTPRRCAPAATLSGFAGILAVRPLAAGWAFRIPSKEPPRGVKPPGSRLYAGIA